ncbi:hypothetical protein V5P93_001318 [Actinokineospora auranticolor]|uniref:Beta-lactamase class A n=1 Tax=Actinokineospora auranticolor TaxID=155976 RepID=A0A2S6GUN0_9PSEU|nr:hypothetical protein [Actinokineospora auranticolor]PPK68948.1 hypothetical protein CLV40_104192 [Actinokineospora auranticolor]
MRHHRFPALLGLFLVLAAGCARAPAGGSQVPQLISPLTSAPTAPAVGTTTRPPSPQPEPPPKTAVDPDSLVAAARGVERSAKVGVLVVDRTSGADVVSLNADRQFRSASLVKLLIAVDALRRGADAATRKRIAVMLQVSDDDIATALWTGAGGSALVTRMVRTMGLTGTRPPAIVGRWGDVLLTARDVARVYRYVLAELPAADRALVVEAMASAPRTAADGFDQHFGIPDGITAEWAVKQGWSNSTNDIVVHSTGLVGRDWRYTVIVLTEHPLGVRWKTAAQSVTAVARVLNPLIS